jgi:hypothetical protein
MTTKQFNWTKDRCGAGLTAEMPDDVTLHVSPDHTTGVLGDKAKRGTAWRAGASHWNEATSTISRFGRDDYSTYKTAKDAMRAAEALYLETVPELDEDLVADLLHALSAFIAADDATRAHIDYRNDSDFADLRHAADRSRDLLRKINGDN